MRQESASGRPLTRLSKTQLRQLCILAFGLWLPLCSSGNSFPDSFDDILKESAGRYMAPHEWRWWKAQCYQESLLNPLAKSHAGAMGLCQIMPGTWAEQSSRMGIQASPYNPRANSLVGAAYMRRMLRVWTAERAEIERLRWAQGSYNCGPGCILKAQKRNGGTTRWHLIEYDIPRETREYIQRIQRWYDRLKGA